LLSGYSDEDVSGLLDGLRIDGFLHKPLRPGAVLDELKAALRAVG